MSVMSTRFVKKHKKLFHFTPGRKGGREGGREVVDAAVMTYTKDMHTTCLSVSANLKGACKFTLIVI